MYFLIDTQDQTVTAARSLGDASRAALDKLGLPLAPGDDPVKEARAAMGDRMLIVNLSGAFEAISESSDQAAQELAGSFKAAVDRLYS